MSKFIALVRRFFLKGGEGQKNSTPEGEGTSDKHLPNDVQIVVKAPRPYDEVILGDDGTGPKVEASPDSPNDLQVAPKRAQRSYEVVELPIPGSDQKIEVKDNEH